ALRRDWLAFGDPPIVEGISPALSLERVPSPDGTNDGQRTWYDYEGLTGCQPAYECPTFEGTNYLPACVALVLPDGSSRFTHYVRGKHSEATQEVSTYSKTDGSVGLRTNQFTYRPMKSTWCSTL